MREWGVARGRFRVDGSVRESGPLAGYRHWAWGVGSVYLVMRQALDTNRGVG